MELRDVVSAMCGRLLVALDGPEADGADTMTVRTKVGDVSLTLELRADPVDGTGDTDNG